MSKHIVSIIKTMYWDYEVEADTEEEAKKKAKDLNNDPNTAQSPVVDWDIFIETD